MNRRIGQLVLGIGWSAVLTAVCWADTPAADLVGSESLPTVPYASAATSLTASQDDEHSANPTIVIHTHPRWTPHRPRLRRAVSHWLTAVGEPQTPLVPIPATVEDNRQISTAMPGWTIAAYNSKQNRTRPTGAFHGWVSGPVVVRSTVAPFDFGTY
jgi:hypothetical protein